MLMVPALGSCPALRSTGGRAWPLCLDFLSVGLYGRANLLSEFLRAVRPCGLGPLTLSRSFRYTVTPADFPRWSGLAS